MTDWTKGVAASTPGDTTSGGDTHDTHDTDQLAASGSKDSSVDWTAFASTQTPGPVQRQGAPTAHPGMSEPAGKGGSAGQSPRSPKRGDGPGSRPASSPDRRAVDHTKKRSLLLFGSLAVGCVAAVLTAWVVVDLNSGSDTAQAEGAVQQSATATTAAGTDGSATDTVQDDSADGADDAASAADVGSAEDPDPDPTAAAVAGECNASPSEVSVAASTNSSRGVIAEFERQYFAGNAEAIPGLLTGGSSMQDTDWDKVLSSVDPGSTYCLRMAPVEQNSGGNVALELAITDQGQRTVYSQIAETVEINTNDTTSPGDKSSRWFIKEIRKAN